MLNAISANCQACLAASPVKVFHMETFKERMRRIRLRAGFTSQGKAAAAIGCERGTVSMWEAPSSSVRAVGSEWLFKAARAYKVRPDWLNDLRAKDDGYPWVPLSRSSFSDRGSQYSGPDPDILHEAVTLLLFDLDHGGQRPARSASDLLLQLYRRIEASGGRLPPEEERAFEQSARARGQQAQGVEQHEQRVQRAKRKR